MTEKNKVQKADSIVHLEMDIFAILSFAKIEEMASEMILPHCRPPFLSALIVFSQVILWRSSLRTSLRTVRLTLRTLTVLPPE